MLCGILPVTAAGGKVDVRMMFQDGEKTKAYSNDVQVKGKGEISSCSSHCRQRGYCNSPPRGRRPEPLIDKGVAFPWGKGCYASPS